MPLRVFNTLTQNKETFETVQPGKVGMYVCGPTVYKPSHIGHAVGPIIFDTVKRYLEFKGYKVTWVVNITDVDDKVIDEARAQGCTVVELAQRVTASYLDSLRQLNVTGIDCMPKASETIGDIIAMCRRLVDKGAAYVSGGDVYFDVSKDPDYGKLSGQKPEHQQSGTRELAGGEKRNPGDFALWKAAKPDEPAEVQFDSPWGKGRPGWHIECSAMSANILGETFDIHGGGMDLIFPHHENEIAQSETCFDKPFVKCWMHNGLTRFNTKKISKSDPEMRKLMEQLVLTNLLSKYSGEMLRFFVLSTHYRRPIEFSDEELAAKKRGLDAFYRLFERLERVTGRDPYAGGPELDPAASPQDPPAHQAFLEECVQHRDRFLEAMDDDFNTGGATGVLFDFATAVNRFIDTEKLEAGGSPEAASLAMQAMQTLRGLGRILGLFETKPAAPSAVSDTLADELMKVLIAVRAEARKAKQFTLADIIRDRLMALNIKLEDHPAGTTWRRDS